MKIATYKTTGEKDTSIEVPAFDVTTSDAVITQYFQYLMNARRNPVANSKNRGDVSGGGKKPYKQKGTGNARAGSSRSPLWVGGGVTFGPTSERNFKQRINSKVKKSAISALFSKAANSGALVLCKIEMDKPSTKAASEILSNLKTEGKVSVITSLEETNIILSFRNIAGIHVMSPNLLQMQHIVSSDKIIVTEKALKELETNLKSVNK